MTSDTSTSSTSEQPRQADRVQLSGVQVAASALASVSAAVVASLFGVTGTVVGAGLVAIISTAGSAIYSSSMKHTSDQLRRAREQLLTARAGEARSGTTRSATALLDRPDRPLGRRSRPPASGSGSGPLSGDETTILAPVGSGTTGSGAKPLGRWRRGLLTVGSRRGLKWPALIGAAVLVFAIAIGIITAFEAITQKPISSLTGHSSTSSTTIGSLTGGSNSTPTPTPSATSSSSDGGSGSATATPSAAPSATRTGGSGATATSSASPKPRQTTSSAPTTSKPSSGNGAGTSGSSGSSSSSGSGGSAGSGGEVQVPVP